MDEVNQILQDDSVPLIRVRQTPKGLQLEVVRYTEGTIFTAISHVWSDRQFGSSNNALPQCQLQYLHSLLAKLPVPFGHRFGYGLRHLAHGAFTCLRSKPQGMSEGHEADWLFWLDTFCIPQDPTQDRLRRKAIDGMNLVYGAASQTLILDADLQDFDAGQEPASDCEVGPPLFFCPARKDVLDGLAQVCGSHWMGRAWTLQEGVVSERTIFQFRGSFAILNILHKVVQHLSHDTADSPTFLRVMLHMLFGVDYPDTPVVQQRLEYDPLAGAMAADMLRIVKASLDTRKSMYDYPLKPDERVRKFIYAHRHLQSRSTTLPEDLPLILVNLSGLNANYVSQLCDADERMRLLIYALGSVPVELLYSDCSRIGNDTVKVDGWIPREVATERFSGEHLLHLGSAGFTFQRTQESTPYDFILLAPSYPRTSRYSLLHRNKHDHDWTRFRVEVMSKTLTRSIFSSKTRMCILIDRSLGEDRLRGAQFVLTRIDHERVFIHYVHSIKLSRTDEKYSSSARQAHPRDTFFGKSAGPQLEFILERSFPQMVDLPRPQNLEQYTARLDLVKFNIVPLVQYPISYYSWNFWCWILPSTKLARVLLCLEISLTQWLLLAMLNSISHRAWTTTYAGNWTPHGPWKWFWKYMNYHSPISHKTYAKTGATISFVVCALTNQYSLMMAVSLYWLVLFERKELGVLWAWALLYNVLERMI